MTGFDCLKPSNDKAIPGLRSMITLPHLLVKASKF